MSYKFPSLSFRFFLYAIQPCVISLCKVKAGIIIDKPSIYPTNCCLPITSAIVQIVLPEMAQLRLIEKKQWTILYSFLISNDKQFSLYLSFSLFFALAIIFVCSFATFDWHRFVIDCHSTVATWGERKRVYRKWMSQAGKCFCKLHSNSTKGLSLSLPSLTTQSASLHSPLSILCPFSIQQVHKEDVFTFPSGQRRRRWRWHAARLSFFWPTKWEKQMSKTQRREREERERKREKKNTHIINK